MHLIGVEETCNVRVGAMNYDEVEVRPGARVPRSDLGKERCPRLKDETAIIVRRSGPSTIRVLFDGRKQPITLHLSYVELPSLQHTTHARGPEYEAK